MRKPGADRRGNSGQRRRRKAWLLQKHGDGESCRCFWCGKPVTLKTITPDRVDPKGTYKRENIVPACKRCNVRRGDASFVDWLVKTWCGS